MAGLTTKCALVTGATSGIGRAVVDRLLGVGVAVVALGRSVAALPDVPGLAKVGIDLAKIGQLPAALEPLVATHPEVDSMILCAGRGRFGGLEQFSYAQMQELMELNFLANAFVCRAFVSTLRSHTAGTGSKLVFVGSEAALEGSHSGAIYCASKFALRGFAQALRKELASSKVGVTTINPGMVDTPFFDELAFEPGPDPENRLTSEQVVDAVMMVLSLPSTAVVDEINLSPLKRSVRKKPAKS